MCKVTHFSRSTSLEASLSESSFHELILKQQQSTLNVLMFVLFEGLSAFPACCNVSLDVRSSFSGGGLMKMQYGLNSAVRNNSITYKEQTKRPR